MARGNRTNHPKGGNMRPETRKLAAIRRDMLENGKTTPLEVLLDNMLHYHLRGQAAERVADAHDPDDKSRDVRLKHLRAMRDVDFCRASAGQFAKEAAPMIHPRLSSVDLGQKDGRAWTLRIEPGDEDI
jgi:hypothetical protein